MFIQVSDLIQSVAMLEDVVNSLISRFLGEYIKDIDKNDLKVSIWKGDVKFRNLVGSFLPSVTLGSENGSSRFPQSSCGDQIRIYRRVADACIGAAWYFDGLDPLEEHWKETDEGASQEHIRRGVSAFRGEI